MSMNSIGNFPKGNEETAEGEVLVKLLYALLPKDSYRGCKGGTIDHFSL
jgi:hypothetical protein